MLYLLFCIDIGEGLVRGVVGLAVASVVLVPLGPLRFEVARFERERGREDGAVDTFPYEPNVEDDFVACAVPLASPPDSLEDEEASLRTLALERRLRSLKKGICRVGQF